MVKDTTHRDSVKDGGAETSRSATASNARRVSNTTNRLGSIVLTLDKLRQITNNFSQDQLLGKGAFGKVYKGVLTNGDMIAVKRFASTITALQDVQYENEAEHLMRLKHPNIVQLVGYCHETEMELVQYKGKLVHADKLERLLCLEYMPKGSLREHLSDETSGLEWNARYKIIEGICYGLHYLHEQLTPTPIIHMDLKPANILLNDNMVPKIADFGLSRLFGEDQTRIYTRSCTGTPGYMAPEYLEKGMITKMFDIFSLGVIILEIITGLKDYPTDETETTSQQYIDRVLKNWRHRFTKASQDIDYQQIQKCIQIGLLCVKYDRVKRLTINQIIKMLRSDEAYQKEREFRYVTELAACQQHASAKAELAAETGRPVAMELLDEYEKLVIRMDMPRVVIDNAVCPTATLVQVDSAKMRGVLLETVQVLADLDLSINKAYISSDGRWFMDVFHVTDRLGRKLTDDGDITYIQQSLGTWNEPARPAALEGLTALELTGADRMGLLHEVFAVLAYMQCSVVDARAWTHHGRLACVVFLRVEELAAGAGADDDHLAHILALLGHVLRVYGEATRAVAAVPAAGVSHADRRLHQLMAADLAPSAPATPTLSPAVSVQSWAERGYSVVTVGCRDRPKLLFDVVCTLHDMDYVVFHGKVDTTGDRAWQEFYIRRADGSPIRSEAERERLCQCLQAAIERRSPEGVRLELCTPDRPGLLSEVTRTFREYGLHVAHAEVSTKGDLASNVFYVTDVAGKTADQSAIDAVRERVGKDRLVVSEEPPRPAGDRDHGSGVGGLGLVYLGNLVRRNLYNFGLKKFHS